MESAKTLLVYESKRGSAQQAALWIAENLPNCTTLNLAAKPAIPNLSEFDKLVIGTGILAGKSYSKVRKFIKLNKDSILETKLFLFITHLEEGEGMENDFQSAFESELLKHASFRAGVGGRLKLDELNFFLRPIMKMISSKKEMDPYNHDNLSRETCLEFAEQIIKS